MNNVTMTTAELAEEIRNLAIAQALREGSCALCQVLSSSDALAALFHDVLKFDTIDKPWMPKPYTGVPEAGKEIELGIAVYGKVAPEFDKFFFCPPHYSTALYSALAAVGRLDHKALDLFGKDGYVMSENGECYSPGFEFESGSLAQITSQAMGYALARKMNGDTGRVFMYLGDGECDEGQTWEAISAMYHYGLNNITILVDCNGYQCDASCEEIMKKHDLEGRFKGFGMRTFTVDGKDQKAIADLCNQAPDPNAPTVILCETKPWNHHEILKAREPRFHYISLKQNEKEYFADYLKNAKK